ncbi:MAG: hypothetical protein U0797_03785 [Gemmataceae bacterium]
MRTLLAVVIPALLATATTAPAQQRKTSTKAARNSSAWATSYQEAVNINAPAEAPPAAPPAPPAPTVSLPPQPPAQPTPAATLAVPVAHPAGGPGCGGCCGHKGGDKCCKLLDWLCHRRSASCAKGCGCCYWCSPPLYSYFGCNCREGAKHDTREPKPCPPSGCGSCGGWGKVWSSGQQMFASPTAQGIVGGVR